MFKPIKLAIDPNSPSSTDDWKHWKAVFDGYVSLYLNVDDEEEADKKKLLALIGHSTTQIYKLIDHCKTYVEAEALLEKLFVKRPNNIFSRHLLRTAKQKPDQSLSDFRCSLVSLAKDCDFKSVTASQYQEEMIRDSFISGIRSSDTRQRLLEHETLTMNEAYDKAMNIEKARKDNRAFGAFQSHELNSVQVDASNKRGNNWTGTSVRSFSKGICLKCGSRKSHDYKNCRAKSVSCFNCGKMGHYSKACHLQKKTGGFSRAITAIEPSNQGDFSEEEDLASLIHCVGTQDFSAKLLHALVLSKVNGKAYKTLLDTGSSKSFISDDASVNFQQKKIPFGFNVSLAQSSSKVEVQSSVEVELNLFGSSYKNTKLYIMKGLCVDVLLGRDFLALHEEVVFRFGGRRRRLMVSNADCAVVAAKVATPSLFGNLKPDWKPIATKSRRFNLEEREFILSTAREWKQVGTVRPSKSPWRAQCVVVKNNGKIERLAIDYSQTINLYTEKDGFPIPLIEDIVNDLAAYKYFASYDLKRAYHQVPIPEGDKAFTAFEAGGELLEFNVIPFGVTNGGPVFQRLMSEILKEDRLSNTYVYFDNVIVGAMSLDELKSKSLEFINSMKRRNMTLNESKTVYGVTELNILGYCVGNKVIRPDPERLKPLIEMPPPSSKRTLKRILGLFAYYAKWVARFSDRIRRLKLVNEFPLKPAELADFENIKQCIARATLQAIDERLPFSVECDASDVAVAATLNQNGRPVAFMSRSLNGAELNYPSIEKEATAIIEAVRKWEHFLRRQHFTLVTDQRSVSFMLDSRKRTKVKNNKILCWRLELASFSYTISYRPGKDNVGPDTLSRVNCSAMSMSGCRLAELHRELGCPGVTRLWHFVRSKNLPYSLEDVKRCCSSCKTCAEIKPKFFHPVEKALIKATQPMERLNVDFKGPLPSTSRNSYFLCVIDEFSRYPFCIPCADISAVTVIKCLDRIFSLFGTCQYVHSDRGSSFMSKQLKGYLLSKGIASSRTTPYHPQGNSQCERYNGVIWKAIQCMLKSQKLGVDRWESVVPAALNSIRSLLCTSTGDTPHSRFLKFTRRSHYGSSLPEWLCHPGPVFLRNFVRSSKHDDLVQKVDLLEANPLYARIRYNDGRESTVSLRDVARYPYESNGKDDDTVTDDEDSGKSPEGEGEANGSGRNPEGEANDPGRNPDGEANDPGRNPEGEADDRVRTQEISDDNEVRDSRTPVLESPNIIDRVEVPRRSRRSNKGVPPIRYEDA